MDRKANVLDDKKQSEIVKKKKKKKKKEERYSALTQDLSNEYKFQFESPLFMMNG